jgi:colanic acid/amylovoran biosynthesis glycosyltransferase
VSAPRVLYVLSRFPCYDEAFLLREIAGVAGRIEVWIFSLKPSRETTVHDEARALLPRTLSVPYLLSWGVLGAQLRTLARRPGSYLAAFAGLLAGNWRSPELLLKNLVFFPKAVWAAGWAERAGITHLHAGWATYPASVAMVVSRLTGLPFSFSGHAHDIYLDTTHLAEKLRRAAFVTTCTEANAAHLLGLAPERPASDVAVVHHGVRLASFSPGPARVRPGGGFADPARPAPDTGPVAPLRLLSVGTLNPHKGFEYLIDALALLGREGVRTEATIVGGGRLEASLRERLARHGLCGNVTMTGALTQAEVLPHYGRASVFVLMAQPEWHWGIPNVIVEALAARNAVVTTRFGSVEELVKDGETGLLVPPKEPAALAAAIRRLAGDETLRARLAEAGHAIVAREFDLEQAVAWYARRFQGLPA